MENNVSPAALRAVADALTTDLLLRDPEAIALVVEFDDSLGAVLDYFDQAPQDGDDVPSFGEVPDLSLSQLIEWHDKMALATIRAMDELTPAELAKCERQLAKLQRRIDVWPALEVD